MPRFTDEDITKKRMTGKHFLAGGRPVIPLRREPDPVPAPQSEPRSDVSSEALVMAAQGVAMAAQAAAESAALTRAANEEIAAGLADLAAAFREKKRWRCVVGRARDGQIAFVDINQA